MSAWVVFIQKYHLPGSRGQARWPQRSINGPLGRESASNQVRLLHQPGARMTRRHQAGGGCDAFPLGARGPVPDSPQGQVGSERPPVPGKAGKLQLRFHLLLEQPQGIHITRNPGPQYPGPLRAGEHSQTGQLERKTVRGSRLQSLAPPEHPRPFAPEFLRETARSDGCLQDRPIGPLERHAG